MVNLSEETPQFSHISESKFNAEHLKYLRQDSSFPLRAEILIFAAGRARITILSDGIAINGRLPSETAKENLCKLSAVSRHR